MEKYIEKICSTHGLIKFVLEGRGYYRCTKCRQERVAERRRKVKEILVQEHGGSCRMCGYKKYMGALHFHHLNPKEKRMELSVRGMTLGIDKLREEANKCILLCANCHAEVEGGIIDPSPVAQ